MNLGRRQRRPFFCNPGIQNPGFGKKGIDIVSPIFAIMAGMRRIHVLNFVRTMTVTTVFFLAPLHFMELGFDGLAIGLIVSLYAAAPILFSFPTGWINDRLSMKKVILGALVLLSVLFVLAGFVRGVPGVAALFLLHRCRQQRPQRLGQQPLLQGRLGGESEQEVRHLHLLDLARPSGGALLRRPPDPVHGFRTLLLVFAAVTALTSLAMRGFDHERVRGRIDPGL